MYFCIYVGHQLKDRRRIPSGTDGQSPGNSPKGAASRSVLSLHQPLSGCDFTLLFELTARLRRAVSPTIKFKFNFGRCKIVRKKFTHLIGICEGPQSPNEELYDGGVEPAVSWGARGGRTCRPPGTPPSGCVRKHGRWPPHRSFSRSEPSFAPQVRTNPSLPPPLV